MFTQHQEGRLCKLVDIFLEENAKINLSALRTTEKCWIGNVLDSLALLEIFPKSEVRSLKSTMDIGTGGGFPLFPLAISLPEATLTGVDATKKKIDAVDRIAKKFDLKNVHLICGRAETFGRDSKLRERFDIVTARAVAPVTVLLEYCAPFARVGGHIVLWKSMDIEEELEESKRAQEELSCALLEKHRYRLPKNYGERQLLVFRKTATTTGEFPRGVGVAKKKPL
ncbi:16S rRNA (guanine(527)-N(7))-methyltransferase RsmG [Candidatus Peregrinibacteria bacterium]|nr:16S rRNA (guanine(527)-N(7))-methyltransferase RsmG [Candidatus Peregrinibacteria bacterium]